MPVRMATMTAAVGCPICSNPGHELTILQAGVEVTSLRSRLPRCARLCFTLMATGPVNSKPRLCVLPANNQMIQITASPLRMRFTKGNTRTIAPVKSPRHSSPIMRHG